MVRQAHHERFQAHHERFQAHHERFQAHHERFNAYRYEPPPKGLIHSDEWSNHLFELIAQVLEQFAEGDGRFFFLTLLLGLAYKLPQLLAI